MDTEKRTYDAWQELGDITAGRPNLGDWTSVEVYRLMHYTLREVLIRRFGKEHAREVLCEAGKLAGAGLCMRRLDTSLDFTSFMAQLQGELRDLKVGVLKVEQGDLVSGEMTFAMYEDLDCSGLPDSDNTVCEYDEGFLAGVLEAYTGKPFDVTEVDCWASGGRVCRFWAVRGDA